MLALASHLIHLLGLEEDEGLYEEEGQMALGLSLTASITVFVISSPGLAM